MPPPAPSSSAGNLPPGPPHRSDFVVFPPREKRREAAPGLGGGHSRGFLPKPKPLGLVTSQLIETSRVRKYFFFLFPLGEKRSFLGARGCLQVPPVGRARDAGQGWHFGGRQGKRGSLYHYRGAEPMAEAEGRHGAQKALLGFMENFFRSHPALQSWLGRTAAPHPQHMLIAELGVFWLLYQHRKKAWAFVPSSPVAAEHHL